MAQGISIREFARRAGCDDKVVRRKIQSGHLLLGADGKLNPDYLDVDWRKGDPLPSASTVSAGSNEDTSLREEAERIVGADTEGLWSKADAEKVKENYAARLKQLEYDRAMGLVVEIDDVVIAVAAEYALVRNKLLGLGTKVATEISTMESPEEIKALIDKQIVEALKGLTVDGNGERDFDKLRRSVQKRFDSASGEAESSAV